MTEDQLYRQLFARLPRPPQDVLVPPGDDCAAIRSGSGKALLLAVDQTVGGRHYYEAGPEAATPAQIARKLLGRNLSDIAAMGGTPRHALVAISQHHGPDWLRRFYDGLLDMAAEYGVYPLGGDWATSSREDICSLTILGDMDARRVVRRSGAEHGDRLFATGRFGNSLPTGYHLRFTPRCREGAWLADHGVANAMIDVSDGLLLDCRRICTASGMTACLDPDAVPRRTPETTSHQALADGEDYELLFAVAADRAEELRREWPFHEVPLTEIGSFRASDTPEVVRPDGSAFNMANPGYDHLARP